jgi:uncharacterized SAM-binding protein YcdF (DUF218 family)
VFGLLAAIVLSTPLVVWWGRALAGPRNDPEGDRLVVLMGSTLDDGQLGQSSYWRAVYAVIAWREHPYQTMIVSGRGGATIAKFVEASGVPKERIVVENRSTSTHENALEVAAMLKAQPKLRTVLLTSDYHMYRAVRAFRSAGLDPLPRPFPDAMKRGQWANWPQRLPVFVELVTETAKIAYYWARGWL